MAGSPFLLNPSDEQGHEVFGEQVIPWGKQGTGYAQFTLDVNGALVVSVLGSNVTKATGSAAPTDAALVGGKDPTGNLHAHQLDANKSLKTTPMNSAGTAVENTEGTLLTSLARTTTAASPNQPNYNAHGVTVTLNITANPGGTETLQLQIQHIDPASGSASNLVSFPVTVSAANNRYTYILYPAATKTIANSLVEVQGLPLPKTWRASVVPSGVGSWIYSVSYSLNV